MASLRSSAAVGVAESVGAAPAGSTRPMNELNLPRPDPARVRPILTSALGILRDGTTLQEAVGSLLPLAMAGDATSDPAIVGLMIAVAALQREESRGAHYRTDFPQTAAVGKRSVLHLKDALQAALDLDGQSPLLAKWA